MRLGFIAYCMRKEREKEMKIRIFCGDGITSSIYAMKLKHTMEEKGMDADVKAFSHVFAFREAAGCDAILIAPHAAHFRNEIADYAGNTPIEIVDLKGFAQHGPEAILNQIENMIAAQA